MDFQELILSLRAETIFPEVVLLVSLLLTVFLDLIFEKSNSGFSSWYQWLPFGGLLISFLALIFQWNDAIHPTSEDFFKKETISFLGSFQGDMIGILFRAFIAISGFFSLLLCSEYIEKSGTAKIEFYSLFLTAILGGMFLAGSNDLVSLFVALETL